GNWLKVFLENRVKNITGIDGDWVQENMLVIPKESFHKLNFEEQLPIQYKADLAVCLEVAEHVSDKASGTLINNLTQIAPVVLFSAAIPLQGGSRHINEQWPDYWTALFEKEGYIPVDCIRRKIWTDKQVSFFYAQNIFIYVKKENLSSYPQLQKEIEAGNGSALPLVHPYMFMYYAERWRTVVPVLGKFPPSFLHAAKRFLNFLKRK
ncbi:hypothetical protein H0W32_02810, partial [Patescibacteria group bacterium]|nr:hypothetical protein [Patescibacteria group bacterium]